MISGTDIQLYLRKVLVDGLEDIKKRYRLFAETPIKILFSNNSPEQNYSNIVIEEYFGDASFYEFADFHKALVTMLWNYQMNVIQIACCKIRRIAFNLFCNRYS